MVAGLDEEKSALDEEEQKQVINILKDGFHLLKDGAGEGAEINLCNSYSLM